MTNTITQKEKKEAVARLRHVRIAPRKARLVIDVVRGMPVNEAEAQLHLMTKRGSDIILKLLRSAIANAEHDHNMAKGNMFIKEARVDEGRRLKRLLPRAMGRGDIMHKKLSHITLVLGEKETSEVSDDFVIPRRVEKENKEAQPPAAKDEGVEQRKEDTGKKAPKVEHEKRKDKPQQGFMDKVFRRKSI